MELREKQIELDKVKWHKSERLGFDACGSFNYCYNCDKSQQYPCAVACAKMEGTFAENNTPVETPAVEEITEKAPKKTAKKTTTKKTTSSKTATKTTTKKQPQRKLLQRKQNNFSDI